MAQFSTQLSNIRAVILDLDGTIVDSAPDIFEAARRARAEWAPGGAELTLAQIETFIGKGADNLVRRLLSLDFDLDEMHQRLPDALTRYLSHYRAVNGQFSRLYEGAREGIAKMHASGLQLACVTNKPVVLSVDLLSALGLRDAFGCVIGGDSLPRRKPDPMPMLHAIEQMKLAPHEVVAIGDSINDAQAARAAGCGVWVVPYGYNHGEDVQGLVQAGLADGIVSSLLDAAMKINSGINARTTAASTQHQQTIPS